MAKKSISAEAVASDTTAPQYLTLPALPRLSWEDWSAVNLDEFRTLFPQFRQLEQTAVPQILTDFYKNSSPDLSFYNHLKVILQNGKSIGENQAQRATQQHYVDNMDKILLVYQTLKDDADLYAKTQEWAKKIRISQIVVKHETPTAVVKKSK